MADPLSGADFFALGVVRDGKRSFALPIEAGRLTGGQWCPRLVGYASVSCPSPFRGLSLGVTAQHRPPVPPLVTGGLSGLRSTA